MRRCRSGFALGALALLLCSDVASAASPLAIVNLCHFPFDALGSAACEIPRTSPGEAPPTSRS